MNVQETVPQATPAGHFDANLLFRRLNDACRRNRVLGLNRLNQRLAIEMKASKLGSRELHVGFLVLCAKNFDFRDIVDRKKPRAHALHVVAEFPVREPVRSESIDDPVRVAELVVEERADDAFRKILPDVDELLAYLIPDVRHISAYHRAFEGDENR